MKYVAHLEKRLRQKIKDRTGVAIQLGGIEKPLFNIMHERSDKESKSLKVVMFQGKGCPEHHAGNRMYLQALKLLCYIGYNMIESSMKTSIRPLNWNLLTSKMPYLKYMNA